MSPLFEALSRTPAGEQAFIAHGLAGWVADALAAEGRPVSEALAQAARAGLVTGLRHKALTLELVDALAARGVVPVLLKGYGLASRLYGAQALHRPSSDVDVLVEPAGLPTVERLLTELQFRQGTVPGVEDLEAEHHHHPWAGKRGLVEVHFRLFTGFGGRSFDDEGVLARAQRHTLDGRVVRYLQPEDEVLYLAVHAANHAFLRVSWLLDVERFVTSVPVRWSEVERRAERAGFRVPLESTIRLMRRLGMTVPDQADVRAPRWRVGLERVVFSSERVADATWSNDRLGSFLIRLMLMDTPTQGARHLLEGARRAWRQRGQP